MWLHNSMWLHNIKYWTRLYVYDLLDSTRLDDVAEVS